MQVQLCGSVHSLDFCDPFWGRRQKTCDGVRDWVETNDTLSLARNGHGVFSGRELLRASPPPPLSLLWDSTTGRKIHRAGFTRWEGNKEI